MNCRPLPPTLFMALWAVAAAAPASALPASSDDALWIEPVRADAVDDAELAGMTGKYFGADMLVGVRIDLVSRLATAGGGSAAATGSVYIRRDAGGFRVEVDTRSSATADTGAVAPTGATATGGDAIAVQGIGQIAQIAGDGNRMGNLAVIQLVGDLPSPQGFNGLTGADAQDGTLAASVHFDGVGLRAGVSAPGASVGQSVSTNLAGNGTLMQFGRIAGDGFAASNTLQLQMMTTAMPTLSLQQVGIQQALLAVGGLPH